MVSEIERQPLRSVLVTGGCGFIGANLVRHLLIDSVRVRVLDNLTRGSSANVADLDVELVESDIRDPEMMLKVVEGVDAVVHLAAFGSVVESVSDPQANFEVNVTGTLNVLRACAQKRIRKFVFASSGGAVLGPAKTPVNENTLPRPASPYGASKLCGEAYCHAFAGSFGLHTVCLRFANVYGPFSGHKRGAVTNFIKAMIYGRPLVIYGDGSATRDFIHVDDVCQGISLALRRDPAPGSVLHLATGVETSIRALASTLASAAAKPDYPISYREKRAGELEKNFASFDRAKALLGFEPRISLAQGLESTWRWFCRNLDAIREDALSDS
jgi:UDP-glucose 4-epimerase